MNLDDNENKEKTRTQDSEQRQDDFNAELSETKAGYLYRTSAADNESRPDIRAKKARKAEAQLTALQAMLYDDPAYAAAYAEAENTIADFEDRMNERLRKIDEQVEDIDEKLEELGPNSAGSEAHKRLIKDREALHRQQQDLLDYHRITIQPMTDRMADQERPLNKDALEEFSEKVRQDMDNVLARKQDAHVTPESQPAQTAVTIVPNLENFPS